MWFRPRSLELLPQFAELVQADPDFELVAPASPVQVCFRAVPDGLEDEALNDLNADLLERVNASGELELESVRLGDRYALLLAVEHVSRAESSIARAWEVIGDAFRGILVDSTDPGLRWQFNRLPVPPTGW